MTPTASLRNYSLLISSHHILQLYDVENGCFEERNFPRERKNFQQFKINQGLDIQTYVRWKG